MPHIEHYHQFEGLHWETGSIRNYLAAVGVKAPHTGQPYSEALLLGISGGIAMGYFSFAYKGYDPHVVVLTRNTFDPLDTLLSRLGIVQTVRQTSQPAKAVSNLLDCLADGAPAIVWADQFSLPYNVLPFDAGMWAMSPILVYGYDVQEDTVWIADRARVPLTVTTGDLAAARSRAKNTRFRLLTLDHPDPDKAPAAVLAGLWDCIKLYTEPPPKGAVHNFGLAAFEHWAHLLLQPKARQSWAKEFPYGAQLYNGLRTAFEHIAIYGKDGNGERFLYAQFLDEASTILDKPSLREVAAQFRRSGQAWDDLGRALLPENVALLGETRQLMLRRHHLFLDSGGDAAQEMRGIDARLAQLRAAMEVEFASDGAATQDLRQQVAAQLLHLRDLEKSAIDQLVSIMAG